MYDCRCRPAVYVVERGLVLNASNCMMNIQPGTALLYCFFPRLKLPDGHRVVQYWYDSEYIRWSCFSCTFEVVHANSKSP